MQEKSDARLLREYAVEKSESAPDWNSVSPLLDEALSALDEQERDALLLRFFKNQDFRAVGAALGVSDDTAQKRVARSLEKLRAALVRRGVTTTTTALSAALASQAVQAAPAGLAAAWVSASLAGAAAESGAALTLIKLMSMTKLQIGVGAILVGGLAATVAIQHQTENKMRGESEALRKQVASLVIDNASLSNRLQQTSAALRLADDQFRELLRLNDKTNLVETLAEENRRLQVGATTSEEPAVETARFAAQRTVVVNALKQIGIAFRVWSNDNADRSPTNFAQLSTELGNVTNFGRGVTLDSFEMVNVGKAGPDYPQGAQPASGLPAVAAWGLGAGVSIGQRCR